MAKTLFLLGAGASADAGIPVTTELTERVVARINSRFGRRNNVTTALNFVVASLNQYNTQRGATPYDGVDIEHVFTAVELLAERKTTLEVTPFVSAWHPAVDAVERPESPSFPETKIERALTRRPIVGSGSDLDGRGIARAIVETIRDEIRASGASVAGRTFELLMAEMITGLKDELAIEDPASVDYLAPLTELARAEETLTIATLNYDLSIELLGGREGVDVCRGIESWADSGTLAFGSAGIHLLKLHGSLDWSKDTSSVGPEELQMPRRTLVIGETRDPFIVFGRRGKLRADGPFLDLIREFRERLNETDKLVVLGYSFRDDHVNECIRSWTHVRPSGEIVIVDPHFPEQSSEQSFRRELVWYLHPRLRKPGEEPGPGRVTVVRTRTIDALAGLLGA